MQFGDGRTRLSDLQLIPIALLLAAICGLAGVFTEYGGRLGALGGPNGLLYDLALRGAQSWRREIKTAPAVPRPETRYGSDFYGLSARLRLGAGEGRVNLDR